MKPKPRKDTEEHDLATLLREAAMTERDQAANLVSCWIDAGWTAERIAEHITAAVWDRPSIETRAEFKAAVYAFFAPLRKGGTVDMTERDQAPAVSEEDRWLASKWFGRGSEPLLADLIAAVRRSGYKRGKMVQLRYERLEEALHSIASNTCCEGCQEAARVAKAAL